ncbi:hypothetical protein [Paenibacillus massiliensis]|uniref:hypothetical protein n=1 Tax=Paenibacillus massiliensis TaxID=225917 RepID=UPI0003F4C5F8|nr:hypothetical protein [Paenibacillus massiliensis]
MSTEFDELMSQAYALPNGRAKIALLEEAIRTADVLNLVEEGYAARSEMVEAGTFGGYPMKALVAFSWMLGQFDREPEAYDEFDLLWSYKWILNSISAFPEISLKQIDNLLEDMRTRYQEYGYSDRTYYYYKSLVALMCGDITEAGVYMDKVLGMERDGMSDCIACEQDQFVEYEQVAGNIDELLRKAEPIVSGRMTCGEIPHKTLSHLFLPLLERGETERADKLERKSYRLVKGERDFMIPIARHITYLRRVHPMKALEVFEKHVAMSIDLENPIAKLQFDGASAALLRQLAEEEQGLRPVLPASLPYQGDAGNLPGLALYFAEQAQATAQRLDQRNGNSFYTELLTKL